MNIKDTNNKKMKSPTRRITSTIMLASMMKYSNASFRSLFKELTMQNEELVMFNKNKQFKLIKIFEKLNSEKDSVGVAESFFSRKHEKKMSSKR